MTMHIHYGLYLKIFWLERKDCEGEIDSMDLGLKDFFCSSFFLFFSFQRQLRYHGFYGAAGLVSKETQVVPDPVEPSNELTRLVYLGSLVSEGKIGLSLLLLFAFMTLSFFLFAFMTLSFFLFASTAGENNESRLGDDTAGDGEGAAIQGVDLEKEHAQGPTRTNKTNIPSNPLDLIKRFT